MTETKLGALKSKKDLASAWATEEVQAINDFQQYLVHEANTTSRVSEFEVRGFCDACKKTTKMKVDLAGGGTMAGNLMQPNWRERLVCKCGMNSRQRLVVALMNEELVGRPEASVYMMEQVTPIASWASEFYAELNMFFSEYLGPEYDSGSIVNGCRHENIERLSFASDSLDLIVSNDVFEHVPDVEKAFSECARVLRQGGKMIATFPFYNDRQKIKKRAEVFEGKLRHILEPQFHGNPVSDDGSLVFTDFGWDVLDTLVNAGFKSAHVELHACKERAILPVQEVFICKK